MRPVRGLTMPFLVALGSIVCAAGDETPLKQRLAPFYEPPAEFAARFGSFRDPTDTDRWRHDASKSHR